MRSTSERPPARKRFGQHFLEPAWVAKVVEAIGARPDDRFIEVGPGRGAITRPLASRVTSLLACEIDRDLAAALRREAIPHVQVLEGDFLTISLEALREALGISSSGQMFRVAGNLPYNVASPILFRLLELSRRGLPLGDATVMVQREVADRLVARPGTRDYGVLSILVGHRARVERLLNLPPGAFRPQPAVHSSVVRLTFHEPAPPVIDEFRLAALTNAVFSRRRKTLRNALLAFGGLTPQVVDRVLGELNIDGRRRPETLYIDELVHISDRVTEVVGLGRPQSGT